MSTYEKPCSSCGLRYDKTTDKLLPGTPAPKEERGTGLCKECLLDQRPWRTTTDVGDVDGQ